MLLQVLQYQRRCKELEESLQVRHYLSVFLHLNDFFYFDTPLQNVLLTLLA